MSIIKKPIIFLKRNFIKPIIIYLLIFLDIILPKKKNLIIFGSNSGRYAIGNPRAIYDVMKEKNPELEIFYWTVDRTIDEKYRLYFWSWRSVTKFLQAKVLVASHNRADFGLLGKVPRRKIFIETWHGNTIKATGVVSKDCPPKTLIAHRENEKNVTHYFFPARIKASGSSLWHTRNRRKFIYVGQPRNDVLLKKEDPRTINLQDIIEEEVTFSKAILYAPTFRSTTPPTPIRFFPFNKMDIDELEEFLENKRVIILIRPHGNEKRTESDVAPTKSWADPKQRTYSINPAILDLQRVILFDSKRFPDVNRVLKDIDILITDYSGIYFDFLLLDRPIVFLPYDLDMWENPDQLLYDYDSITPGPKVKTFQEFMDALENIFKGVDQFQAERKVISRMFNFYESDNSAVQCRNLILDLINNS